MPWPRCGRIPAATGSPCSPSETTTWPSSLHRVGPDGKSSIEILSDVTRTLVVLGEALHQISVNPTPVLHAAVIDPAERQWDTPPPEDLEEALEFFADEAGNLSEAVGHVPAEAWTRTGTVAGGGSVSAIDVVPRSGARGTSRPERHRNNARRCPRVTRTGSPVTAAFRCRLLACA